MGTSLMKLTPGRNEERTKLIEKCYDKYCKDIDSNEPNMFYQAVCQTVEEINSKCGYTQIRIPRTTELEWQFKRYSGEGKQLTSADFQNILQSLVSEATFTNAGALDSFFYIFGAPAAALLIKNAVNPKAISNQVLVPGITSATVLVLAALKKI